MTFLKNTNILLGLLLLAFTLSSPARAADDAAARMEAAIAYEKAVPVESMVKDMMAEMEKNPQLALTDSEKKIMRESYDVKELRQKMLDAIAKHFTVPEIEALTKFYASAEGQSIMKKFPVYMADFMPYIQQQTMTIIQKLMEDRAKQETPKP